MLGGCECMMDSLPNSCRCWSQTVRSAFPAENAGDVKIVGLEFRPKCCRGPFVEVEIVVSKAIDGVLITYVQRRINPMEVSLDIYQLPAPPNCPT